MYKYANKLLHPAMNTLYVHNRDVHRYSTRQKHLLHINKININEYANIFSNTSARVTVDLISKTQDPNYGYARYCAVIYNGATNQVCIKN